MNVGGSAGIKRWGRRRRIVRVGLIQALGIDCRQRRSMSAEIGVGRRQRARLAMSTGGTYSVAGVSSREVAK